MWLSTFVVLGHHLEGFGFSHLGHFELQCGLLVYDGSAFQPTVRSLQENECRDVQHVFDP